MAWYQCLMNEPDTTITLSVGLQYVAIVDNYTFTKLGLDRLKLSPQVHKRAGKVYVQYWDGVTSKALHRLIAGAKKGQVVDHINGDGLDNRSCNLRIATIQQNRANCGPRKGIRSGLKGVARVNKASTWSAAVTKDSIRYYLGTFKSKRRAGLAVDRAAKALHGAFAGLNYPEAHTRPVMPTGGYKLKSAQNSHSFAPIAGLK